MYGLQIATAPTAEPITLAEAKKQCELATSYTAHDDHLMRLVQAARRYVEDRTNRAIVSQTWDMYLDAWPEGTTPIYVPKPPLQSVTHVKYYDTDGTQQTWSNTNYIVSTSREPGRIACAYGVSYPSIQYRVDAVTVRFVCGYGAQSAVPEHVKAAILLLVAHWFEHREEVVTGTITNEIPSGAQALIQQLQVGDEFTNYMGVC